jgi:hypothetical protein
MEQLMIGYGLQWLLWLAGQLRANLGWPGLIGLAAGGIVLATLSSRVMKFIRSPAGLAAIALVAVVGLYFARPTTGQASNGGRLASRTQSRRAKAIQAKKAAAQSDANMQALIAASQIDPSAATPNLPPMPPAFTVAATPPIHLPPPQGNPFVPVRPPLGGMGGGGGGGSGSTQHAAAPAAVAFSQGRLLLPARLRRHHQPSRPARPASRPA